MRLSAGCWPKTLIIWKPCRDQVIAASDFPVIFIDEDFHQRALDIFREQTKRGISLTDCANVAVMQRFGITSIFSFDKFYAKEFGLTLAGE